MDELDDPEVTRDELRAWARAAMIAGGLDADGLDGTIDVVLPAAEEAYESALVQGLCRDGAREILETTALAEARRLLSAAARA